MKKEFMNKIAANTDRNYLLMSIVEGLAFIGICGFNLYHIKGMLNDRRII